MTSMRGSNKCIVMEFEEGKTSLDVGLVPYSKYIFSSGPFCTFPNLLLPVHGHHQLWGCDHRNHGKERPPSRSREAEGYSYDFNAEKTNKPGPSLL